MPGIESKVDCTWNRNALQVVEMVDELAEPPGAASIEVEDEPGELTYGRFIKLFLQRTTLVESAVGKEIRKAIPNLFELFLRDGLFESHCQLPPHKS